MAKQQNNPDPAEVVIFFARTRGGGEVVAQSVRALADAVERASQPRIQVRPAKALAPANDQRAEKTLFDAPDEVIDAADEEVTVDPIETPPTANGRKKRGEGDPQDRNGVIALVGDINFVPSGKDSLKAFFGSKAASSDMDQILVLAHFFQRTLELPKYGVGHILTAFKHVGERVSKRPPSDDPQLEEEGLA